MDQDEGNRAAFDAVARAWHVEPNALAADDAERRGFAGRRLRRRPIGGGVAGQAVERRVAPRSVNAASRAHEARIPRRVWLAAASVVIAIAALLTMHRYLERRGSHSDEFTTRTGEQIEITLADGSRVWLGPQSNLRVAFNKVRRGIQLTTGEAFFSVKKDPTTVRRSLRRRRHRRRRHSLQCEGYRRPCDRGCLGRCRCRDAEAQITVRGSGERARRIRTATDLHRSAADQGVGHRCIHLRRANAPVGVMVSWFTATSRCRPLSAMSCATRTFDRDRRRSDRRSALQRRGLSRCGAGMGLCAARVFPCDRRFRRHSRNHQGAMSIGK